MRHLKFLAVCCYLLQQVTADPRPNFGIAGPVAGSAAFRDVSGDVAALALTISSDIYPTLISGYPNLDVVVYFMQQIGENVDTLAAALDEAQGTLIDATTGDAASLFSLVDTAITDFLAYIENDLSDIETALSAVIEQYVSDQLMDDFGRVRRGLQVLQSALGELEHAVRTAIATAGTNAVPGQLIRKIVKKSLVNAVLVALQTLKAYLPVINYTLKSTVAGVVVADRYIHELTAMVDDASTTMEDYGQMLLDHGAAFKDQFSAYLNDRKTAINNEIARSQLVPSVANSALTAALNSFTSPTADVPGDVQTYLGDYFDDRYNAYELSRTPGNQQFTVDSSLDVFLLIHTLIKNWHYSEFCFYKYAYLVADLILEGLNYSLHCIEHELLRLDTLMELLQLLIDQLQYEVEDIYDELTVCNNIADTAKMNACFTMLAGYYHAVGHQFGLQYQLVLELAEDEIHSSTNRMLACIAVANVAGVQLALGDIDTQIIHCSNFGPDV